VYVCDGSDLVLSVKDGLVSLWARLA
jgi:hypothetical protein